ncbi:DUF5807 family protein [Halopenitus sp. H-Gu1]|uniref:DUF5807 family protein n=1 Tax=Halopenitus sp. H-Gu1 TaxID=3242697 RepID=UPI00359F041F
MSDLEEFLAGERLDDVVLFVSDTALDADSRLRNVGDERENGVVVVADGERGRSAFEAGTGMDVMEFTKEAMETTGEIDETLDGATCPAEGEDDETTHEVEFVFAFAEGQNEDVGGLYAEGDVIHAYAHCSCGENFSRKWIAGE